MAKVKINARDRLAVDATPRRDWLLVACAVAGVLVSGYLAVTKLTGGHAAFCTTGTSCDIIQSSRYAMFLGIPTAAWGAALYAVVLGLALSGLSGARFTIVFALASAAVAFSAYMTYLALALVRAACPWCLLDAVVAVAVFAVTLWHRPIARGRRASTRPVRLAAIGIASAVVTVVFAAGVFVAGSPTTGSRYQEDLARHLASTGAIFYGAYW
jgi:uncharacterized membrane protein